MNRINRINRVFSFYHPDNLVNPVKKKDVRQDEQDKLDILFLDFSLLFYHLVNHVNPVKKKDVRQDEQDRLDLKGDAPKIIYEAGCGLAVEPGNLEGLAESVLKLYSNTKLCKEMRIKGRKYAVENFTPEVCVTKYEKLFRSCRRQKIWQ